MFDESIEWFVITVSPVRTMRDYVYHQVEAEYNSPSSMRVSSRFSIWVEQNDSAWSSFFGEPSHHALEQIWLFIFPSLFLPWLNKDNFTALCLSDFASVGPAGWLSCFDSEGRPDSWSFLSSYKTLSLSFCNNNRLRSVGRLVGRSVYEIVYNYNHSINCLSASAASRRGSCKSLIFMSLGTGLCLVYVYYYDGMEWIFHIVSFVSFRSHCCYCFKSSNYTT